MRYVPIKIVSVSPSPGQPAVAYSTADFLREQVWPRAEWRASNEAMQTLLELIEAFSSHAPVSMVVPLQDKQHEMLSRMVVLPGQARDERFRPDLVAPLTELMLGVTMAPNKPPEGWQQDEVKSEAKTVGNGGVHP